MSGYFITLSIAAVVVTADNEYKEQNYHVPRVINELKEYGLRVDIFDLDKQNATELLKYDVVEFIGGNPYYLLNSIRVHKASSVIKQLAEEKLLLGYSAGAMVFTPSIIAPMIGYWSSSEMSNGPSYALKPHFFTISSFKGSVLMRYSIFTACFVLS